MRPQKRGKESPERGEATEFSGGRGRSPTPKGVIIRTCEKEAGVKGGGGGTKKGRHYSLRGQQGKPSRMKNGKQLERKELVAREEGVPQVEVTKKNKEKKARPPFHG